MRTIRRSRSNRVIAGVLGGFAEAYGIDANLLRLVYVVLALFTGVMPMVGLYLLGWYLIPKESPIMEM